MWAVVVQQFGRRVCHQCVGGLPCGDTCGARRCAMLSQQQLCKDWCGRSAGEIYFFFASEMQKTQVIFFFNETQVIPWPFFLQWQKRWCYGVVKKKLHITTQKINLSESTAVIFRKEHSVSRRLDGAQKACATPGARHSLGPPLMIGDCWWLLQLSGWTWPCKVQRSLAAHGVWYRYGGVKSEISILDGWKITNDWKIEELFQPLMVGPELGIYNVFTQSPRHKASLPFFASGRGAWRSDLVQVLNQEAKSFWTGRYIAKCMCNAWICSTWCRYDMINYNFYIMIMFKVMRHCINLCLHYCNMVYIAYIVYTDEYHLCIIWCDIDP